MRTAWAQVRVLLFLALLIGSSLADGGLTEPSLLLGAVGALLLAWGVARPSIVPVPPAGPAAAVRAHHRALARRAVSRQRDPDAAGHTRSRAPSGFLPAA